MKRWRERDYRHFDKTAGLLAPLFFELQRSQMALCFVDRMLGASQ